MSDFIQPDGITDELALDIDNTIEDIVNRRTKLEFDKKTLSDDTKAAAERLGFKPAHFNTMIKERHTEKVSQDAQNKMAIVDFNENIRDRARAIRKARGG